MRRRIAQLKGTIRAVNLAALDFPHMQQALLRSEIDRLRADRRYADPKNLVPYGRKAFCQCDEDGIVFEIFRRIGTTSKCFVEFGVGDGIENNTLALLHDDWHGLWIEASPECTQKIRDSMSRIINSKRLKLAEAFITKDNINALISENLEQADVDLLSVDVDGNDYHILSAITCIRPRVVVIEYNAKFFPPIRYCMEYDPSHVWQGDDCFGASLAFLEAGLRDRGFSLVGCSLSGANAFFVSSELKGDKFLEPYSAENHYQPARYYLNELRSGHSASYNTLSRSMSAPGADR